jgi:Domain of unknown function (DUF5658)
MTTVEFSNRALVTFLALQALDVITTMIGLNLGAGESSVFINRLLQLGQLPGLLISKLLSVILVTAVIAFGRGRLMRILNPWYALLVTWNLVVIFMQAQS